MLKSNGLILHYSSIIFNYTSKYYIAMTLLQNAANDFFDSGLEIKTLQDTQKYIDDYYNSFDKIFKKKISKDTLYDAIIKEAKKEDYKIRIS